MRILFLDLASHEASIVLLDEQRAIAHASIVHQQSEKVMPAIEDLLRKVQWTFSDLTHIACTVGPGGFMSLRVGVSTANALSYSLKIPVAGIHLSDLWNSRIVNCPLSIVNFVWLHSTRRDSLFIRGFGDFKKKWPQSALISLAEARELPPSAFVGELTPEHQQALTQMRCADIAESDGILPSFLSAQTYDKQLLIPWYGRGM